MVGTDRQDSNDRDGGQDLTAPPAEQISLFAEAEVEPQRRRQLVNPHLLAARRLARMMRQLPDHSVEQTRAGLAICRQLKAYIQDEPGGQPRH